LKSDFLSLYCRLGTVRFQKERQDCALREGEEVSRVLEVTAFGFGQESEWTVSKVEDKEHLCLMST
jgi:hypothetical protein